MGKSKPKDIADISIYYPSYHLGNGIRIMHFCQSLESSADLIH